MVQVVVTEQQLGPSSEPTLRDLSEALITVYGTDFGIHSPTWISRFSDDDTSGQWPTARDESYSPATRRTCITRPVDRASASVYRMR